jgi:hypothetical protein
MVCSPASWARVGGIRQAGADGSRAVVIMPLWEHDSLVWHREFADALADRLKEHDHRRSRPGVAQVLRGHIV